jgi:hypothetical protein
MKKNKLNIETYKFNVESFEDANEFIDSFEREPLFKSLKVELIKHEDDFIEWYAELQVHSIIDVIKRTMDQMTDDNRMIETLYLKQGEEWIRLE